MNAVDGQTGKRRRRPRVLVVDDEEAYRQMVSDILNGAGYVVVEAGDGADALEMLLDPEAPEPNVLVLDLQMPRMSGPELLKVMKSYHRLNRIPVIVSSAGPRYGMAADPESAWLPKPFLPDQLLELVRQASELWARRVAASSE
jgi:CheY-like chemotaxis protein